MELVGKIKVIRKAGNEKYPKTEVVLTTDEQYPQDVLFEFGGEKCVDLPDPYNVGENAKIHFNLRGREWINPEGEAKYFNSLQGWRIEKVKDVNNVTVNDAQVLKEEPTDEPF